MPTRQVIINIDEIGTDSGPFTISDDVLGVLDTNVPRTSLLGGYAVNSDTTATQITVTSTGPCNDSTVIEIGYVICPPPPTPSTVYYVLERCSDANTFYSIGYLDGTFANNARVTVTVSGITYTYIIIGQLSVDPGGGLLTLTATGLTGCPGVPPSPPPPLCILVVNEVIAPEPQTGANNYFGVKVSLDPFPVDENVTVNGYIRDDGDITNTYSFSLTIIAGTESEETANNVLMTGPADTATIFINSITPTSVTYDGDTVPICGYE
jgi:hypothetical protein